MNHNQATTSHPFFDVVDRLATNPAGADAITSDDGIRAALGTLTPEQRDALLSGDWGRIQTELYGEQEKALAPPSGAKDGEAPAVANGPFVLARSSADDNPWIMKQVGTEADNPWIMSQAHGWDLDRLTVRVVTFKADTQPE